MSGADIFGTLSRAKDLVAVGEQVPGKGRTGEAPDTGYQETLHGSSICGGQPLRRVIASLATSRRTFSRSASTMSSMSSLKFTVGCQPNRAFALAALPMR